MNFYDLQFDSSSAIDFADGNDWESITCSRFPGHQRAGKRITPLHVEVKAHAGFDVGVTILSDIVISDRVLRLLRAAGLTGFTVQKAVPHFMCSGKNQPAYVQLWELCIIGKAGYAHPRSGIKIKMQCEFCGLTRYTAFENGIHVNQNTYDGSNFCTVEEYPKHVLVNDEAKSILEKLDIPNVSFVESTKLKWPEGVLKP